VRARILLLVWLPALAAEARNGPVRLAQPAGPCEPTLEQCQDHEWLKNDPCGIQQREEAGACDALLEAAFRGQQEGADAELRLIDRTLEPGGVADVYPTTPDDLDEYYEPDLFRIVSQERAHIWAPGTNAAVFGVDQHDVWDGNGARINSCEEYAYEKYYDSAVFSRFAGGAVLGHGGGARRRVRAVGRAPVDRDSPLPRRRRPARQGRAAVSHRGRARPRGEERVLQGVLVVRVHEVGPRPGRRAGSGVVALSAQLLRHADHVDHR
jgi:hypothetical protein